MSLFIDQIEAGAVKSDMLRHPFQDKPEDFIDIEVSTRPELSMQIAA